MLQSKFAMRAKPNDLQRLGVGLSIDQHQVGFDVAIPMVVPVASKCMVPVPRFKGLIICESPKDRLQVSINRCTILPPNLALVVTPELPGRLNPPHAGLSSEP